MKQLYTIARFFLLGIGLTLILSSCAKSGTAAEDSPPAKDPQMRITLIEAYQGVKDGNTESVQLPTDSAFITIRICVENLSTVQESVYRQDVFLDLGDNIGIYPVALGYDQAEAFSWALPIASAVGAKRIDHKFYFFLIQKNELLSVPAYQSMGCDNSAQFKSLALLFIVKKESAGEPHILRFLKAPIPFTAKKVLSLSPYIVWIAGLGSVLVIVRAGLVLLRKRRLERQVTTALQEREDAAEEV